MLEHADVALPGIAHPGFGDIVKVEDSGECGVGLERVYFVDMISYLLKNLVISCCAVIEAGRIVEMDLIVVVVEKIIGTFLGD
jgi:hypothetical protein